MPTPTERGTGKGCQGCTRPPASPSRRIAWSYDLLAPAEQRLFRRLAVFEGGCRLEAAEAVGNAAGDLGLTGLAPRLPGPRHTVVGADRDPPLPPLTESPPDPVDALAGVEALVRQSLLPADEAEAEVRFRLLETLREYAWERLVESGELAAARAALGEEAFAAAWAAGREMGLERASEDALGDWLSGKATAPAQPPRAAGGYPDDLTEREVEVLRLLASGRTNREIAAALVISLPTVDRHVANVYAKTGVHSRAAAATYALRHNLLPSHQGAG